MKKINTLLVILITLLFTACGSSNYNYRATPSPLVEGATKFSLNKFTFTLEDSNKNELNHFMNEDTMKNKFKKSITREMNAYNLVDKDKGFLIDLEIKFIRNYMYHGDIQSRDSINLPYFTYQYKVYNKNYKLLATCTIPQSVIDYKSLIMDIEIATFQRKSRHEIEDINHISKYLVKTWLGIKG